MQLFRLLLNKQTPAHRAKHKCSYGFGLPIHQVGCI